MKAYEVTYSTPRTSSNKIILISLNEDYIEENLKNKVEEFKKFSYPGGSRILFYREISLSNVMIKDLSISEFLKLNK